MSFLAPILLVGLPLALLPIIIHLIHLLRRRKVRWAAMEWLMLALKMNKGLSKLRQYLILAFRALAVAALIFVIGRPLAGGLLGLTGGAPDTVLLLLDRSASMEQQLLATGVSKRLAGLRNLTAAIKDAYGKRSKLVLIDSATLQSVLVENADALADLPRTGPTDSSADIPSLLQAALDYISTNQTGRTDVWLMSDLRQTDWNAAGGRWPALRSAFSSLRAVRFHVFAYPETSPTDLAVSVEKVERRETAEKAELLLDIRVRRSGEVTETTPAPVSLRVVVNGVGSTVLAELKSGQVLLQAQSIPIDKATKRGWGRVELPADASPADNVFHFVFDEPAPLRSVVVSDRGEVSGPMLAALNAPADPSRKYEAKALTVARAAEIPWEETGLIVWQAPIPDQDAALAKQLEAHARAGRALLFLPPETPTAGTFAGLRWSNWQDVPANKEAVQVDWWRNDSGLLAGARDGSALPVGEVQAKRWCGVEGEHVPLARFDAAANNAPLLLQPVGEGLRSAYFLATLPGPGASSLARDGVALFALLHRALNQGSVALGNSQQKLASANALGDDPAGWKRLDKEEPNSLAETRPLRAGVWQRPAKVPGKPEFLIAVNRPPDEDASPTLPRASLDELMAGMDWRLLERTLENEKSLTSEIWRTFLMAMAVALILEALLCMPAKRQVTAASDTSFLSPAMKV